MGHILKVMLKAKVGFLATARRPHTDGRFARLIPSLLSRCGYQVGSSGPSSPQINELSGQNSLVIPKKPGPKGNQWGAILQKMLRAKPRLIYINSIDLQVLAFPFQIIFGSKVWADVLENDFTNTLFNGRYAGVEQKARRWIIQLLQKMLPWNNVATVAEESFFQELRFGKHYPLLLEHESVPMPYPLNQAKPQSK